MIATKSELIAEALNRRYPCEELPYGTFTKMAEEFNVSRELVRQIARRNGFAKNHISGMRTDKIGCAICGKIFNGAAPKSGICLACRWIELPCSNCGTMLKRRAADVARFARAHGTGRVFCNQKCRGCFASKNKQGRPAEPIVHGTHSGYLKEHSRKLPHCEPCIAAARLVWKSYSARA